MIKNACSNQKITLKSIIGSDISSDSLDLLNKLLVFNPIKRLTAEQALGHAYVGKFHDESEEIEMHSSVTIPLNDDVRLSVDDYRNKLYEIMSSHHNAKPVKTYNKGIIKLNADSMFNKQDVKSKVCKDTERYLKTRYQVKEKPYNTQSEPKLSHTQNKTRTPTVNIKSDSKIPKHYITFPSDAHYHKAAGDVKKNIQSSSEVQTKKIARKRTMNSKSNIYMAFNSYNQTHGIITQTALMELKAAGLR